MNSKLSRLMLFLLLGCVVLQFVPYASAQAYPSDLAIWAISGGPAPWERLERVEIDSDGSSTYWLMTNRTSGEWTLNASFVLNEENLTQIWNEIQMNDFFNLAPNYTDPEWMDGSYCIMNITADLQTHMVITRNVKVPRFDAIAAAINNATPGDSDLTYNAIIAEWDPLFAAQTSEGAMASVTLQHEYELSPSIFVCWASVCGTILLGVREIGKAGRGTRRRTLPHLLKLLGALSLAAVLTAQPVLGETVVTSGKCNVKVDLYLEFSGSGATQAFVDEYKKGIEDVWNGNTWCTLCTITFTVTAVISAAGNTQPTYHQIEVVHWQSPMKIPRWTATKNGFIGTTGKTGAGRSWCSDLADPGRPTGNRAAHETGHLMGRDDTYVDVPVDPSDPKQGTRSVPKDPKYIGDIMAQTWNTGAGSPPKPHKEHTDGIIRDSGQIPPPFADALPKTVTIVIPNEGRKTGSFSIKISNPTDGLISVTMTFAWTGVAPSDTVTAVLTGSVDVSDHGTTTVSLPSFSVGPLAEPGLYPCRITWRVTQTGDTFDTDPYLHLVKPVGGDVVPVDKLGLLAPYFGLASIIVVATIMATICIRRVGRRNRERRAHQP